MAKKRHDLFPDSSFEASVNGFLRARLRQSSLRGVVLRRVFVI
jgi:hypothetical protein